MDALAAPALEASHDLVDRCVAGEQAAWRDLHRQHYPTALSLLRRLGVPANQLEDACQEVFVDVFRYLSRFRHEAQLRTWLYRICVSHARIARRRARLTSLLSTVLQGIGGEPRVEPLEEGVASRQLAKALDRLSEAERVVFVLFELQGLPGKEIAEIIDRPEATVFRRLHDARKRFVAALEQVA